ncbi:MAG: SHOCT domain-containing protein [Euzebyales bacterium]|nr:SHOCT domain-containing protein [Euzebyales bacterium]
MGGGGMMGGMWALGIVWLLAGLVVIALMVAAIVWLVRSQTGDGRRGVDDARSELDRRYAAGEVAREDYLQRRGDLAENG